LECIAVFIRQNTPAKTESRSPQSKSGGEGGCDEVTCSLGY
jgi:hypothetical protein